MLSLGCGLLLERVSDLRLSGTLVLPCGFAVLALIAQLATTTSTTARLATPAVVAAAVAGFALSGRAGIRRPDWWALAATVGVFAAYAAPIVLSGRATFAGYIKLDDDSTFLALVDRAMEHGRSLAGLEPSSYLRTLEFPLAQGYPLATFMPLGVGRELVRGDAIWLYQPCLAVMAAMLALVLYTLSGRVIDSRPLQALIAFVSAQSALLYGYALWGGIKELGSAWAVPLLVALVPPVLRSERIRHLIPLAVVTALLFGVLNVGAIVWVAPALAFALVLIFRNRGPMHTIRAAAAFAAFLVVLSLPPILAARDFFSSNLATFSALANLIKPLNPLQVAGIWPAGDFRFDPQRIGPTYVLIAVALVAAAAGAIEASRRGGWEIAVFAVGAPASALVLYAASTPWIEGKAFATASPAIPFAALIAAGLLFRGGRRVEGAVLATVIAGAVFWSNVLQYHDAWLAPRSQLAELELIGNRFAGASPSLMTEYQPYGVRHLLRKLDAEGASELRFRQVPLRDGQSLPPGGFANLDDFDLAGILVYRSLVLRRSPGESRPPSPYRLVWKGTWYELWQRPETSAARVLEHLPLGTDQDPGATPTCADVLRTARTPGTTVVAAVERPPVVAVNLSRTSVPAGWGVDASGRVIPGGPGTLETSVSVPTSGRYLVWIGGSFRDRMDVFVDGRRLGTVRHQLNNNGQYTQFGQAALRAGAHTVTLEYHGSDLRPGSGGVQFPMGPLVLSTTTADLPVMYVQPSNAASLCGRNLDWVEALGS